MYEKQNKFLKFMGWVNSVFDKIGNTLGTPKKTMKSGIKLLLLRKIFLNEAAFKCYCCKARR